MIRHPRDEGRCVHPSGALGASSEAASEPALFKLRMPQTVSHALEKDEGEGARLMGRSTCKVTAPS
eukprot:11285411-Alexandrium_andersonii.AAC.1